MRLKGTFSLFLIVMLSIMLILTACGGKQAAPSEPSQPSEQSEQKEEKKVDFPTKRIEIIVPAGPGGGTDNLVRTLSPELSEILGVPINVLNLPGANGAIGLQEQNSRPADGYTIQAVVSTIQTEIALGNVEQPELIRGITAYHEDTYALHVRADSKYDSIEKLIEEAKAHPGQIKLGGMYTLALDEIVVRKFEKAAGIKVNYIPYSDTGKMQADLLGGHIDVLIDEFPPSMELIKANKVKPLIVFAKERLESFPEVPCSVEMGMDVTDGQLRGFIIHRDTPEEIVKIWEDALRKAFESENYQKYAEENLLNLKDAYMNAEEYDATIKRQVEEYKQIFAELQQ